MERRAGRRHLRRAAGAGRTGRSCRPPSASAPTRPSPGSERRVEAFVIDAPPGLDLYGEHVGLTFTARLRDTLRFDGVEPLVAQMAQRRGSRARRCSAVTRTGEPDRGQRRCRAGRTHGRVRQPDQEEPVASILVVDDDPSVRALLRDVLEARATR